ncbi:MAG: DsrE/DsrF/DrsH-like family protein [Actinobacteria bacterium]|nr:DsrE/DsrF/DrsH-like family protein [Actinomycetota bacterium]
MSDQQKPKKAVSIMCFHDELCQVFNAMMTALSLLRTGSKVTIFFGSRGINAVHKQKIHELTCLPDQPKEVSEAVMKRMEEMDLPDAALLLETLYFEGATILACPLNLNVFGMTAGDLAFGVKVADPSTYYKEVMVPADINLAF